ncbi:uncharacterized protein LOC121999686 [Zingiber officinale]|uniref:DUF4408 domain-containing protein n=1 Tax=Zingiber officinale TaxID=94328 RepID=A0A8J5FZS6_ZINOF|nr:uncharacterized protein LOC121999686 [Zingiber officinale]KAG6493731.1 hypothetical protein ZIOFF_048732 [Zingiber officinale]
MDSVKKEKLEAMERYRKGSQFLRVLMQFVLRVVLLGLFMSSPNWLPCFFSSVKFFFLVRVPKICTMAAGPRFIFMISNVIIVILVGGSRLPKNPAERVGLYEEYVMKSPTVQSLAMAEVKENEAFADQIVKAEALREEKDEESEVDDVMEEEEEEEEWLPAEELNKRVEDFIAMVNKQRKLEAKMLICCE